MKIAGVVVLGLFVVCAARSAQGEEPLAVQWKLSTTSIWPPASADGKVILKSGDTISAHAIASGRLVWSQRLSNLRYGEGVLAAGGRTVYVLSDDGIFLLGATDGQQLAKRPLAGPTSIAVAGRFVYVTTGDAVYRYDAGGRLLLQARGFVGELRGADGDHAAIYAYRPNADPQTSPKRLSVVNLRTGKQSYEFKLLPVGEHRVIRMGGGRLVFIDYSQTIKGGQNPRKLYYTEADYLQGKKLKDISLSAKYTNASADTFWVVGDPAGVAYFLNGHGGGPSTLFAYDARQGKTLWSHTVKQSLSGLLLHDGQLWTVGAGKDGEASAVAYSAATGRQTFRNVVDAPGVGSPVAVGGAVLVRTRDTVYCFARGAAPQPAASVPAPGVTARSGWRVFRDRVAGYLIQTPQTWTFDRSAMRSLGGVRFVIPFSRTSVVGGRAVPVGTLHLLTYEAAGRDVNALWQSVWAQRRRLSPDVRAVKLERLTNVGGSGADGIVATYSFQGRQGYPVQLRSLCVVHHNVAFELRGWAGPQSPQEVWQDVQGIMDSFKPQTF